MLRDDSSVAYIIHRVEDVTDRVRIEHEKLRLDRALTEMSVLSRHYSQLIDTAPDALVVVRDDARIELVNVQTETMFGYSRDELLGQPLELLIPERFRAGHLGHMSRFFVNPASRPMGSSLELFGRRKDGSELPIEVSLSPQRDERGMTVSASIRDISERRRFEAAARLTADRLRSAVDSIQDAFALFDHEDRLVLCNSVFRRLVHESQLGALVGKPFSEILDAWLGDIDFPDEAARARFREDRLARRMQEPLINDILDLSRIEAGRITISPEPVDVAETLDEVIRTLDPISARQSITLEAAALPSALPKVIADRTRFGRQPEIVIMDINLPGMSGLDALRALQAAPETQHIPVIALTAAASERDRQRGIEAGFFRYLAKPIKVDELIDAIEALLSAS